MEKEADKTKNTSLTYVQEIVKNNWELCRALIPYSVAVLVASLASFPRIEENIIYFIIFIAGLSLWLLTLTLIFFTYYKNLRKLEQFKN